MSRFEPLAFRQHFPLLLASRVNQQALVYFDNGATTQKPKKVIDSYQHFYQSANANVHRSSHALSHMATQAFEKARDTVKTFIKAQQLTEIIWTKGTTEGINLVAHSLARNLLKVGDEIVLSQSEHHANIVPWQLIAQQTGAVIKILPLALDGRIDVSALDRIISSNTRLVCCAHISNVLGRINPIETIIARAKQVGALTLIDGAQAVAHLPVDVQALDCDFYVFSAHKMFGPTGVGVLYGKEAVLNTMQPYQAGGEMIKSVSFEQETTFQELPFKFEAGTPNIAGVIAFAEAINFIQAFNFEDIIAYEQRLVAYCMQQLSTITEVKFICQGQPDIPVIAFTVEQHHSQDIASALDQYGIALRNGNHCAMPLMHYLAISGCLRISLSPYNTIAEIDFFIEKLRGIVQAQSTTAVDSDDKVKHDGYSSNDIVELFSTIYSWDGRHRQIMLLAKKLVRLTAEQRSSENTISGCESAAWITACCDASGAFSFNADSDAKIIRGLLVIILAAFEHKTAAEINNFDIEGYFSQLGLLQHLSPSRGNGVKAIVKKIHHLVNLH